MTPASPPPPTPAYVFVPYRLVPAQRLLMCREAPVKLGGRAFDILVTLVERRDRAVSKNELLDIVWPGLVVEENNLQVQMVALRKLLGHQAIATVPGRGYCFTLPVTREGCDPLPARGNTAEPLRADAQPTGKLSAASQELFGRDEDLRTLLGLLDRHSLVTIAGAAGIGKTRLAQAATGARAGSASEGAWWVDLAPLTESALVPVAVAIALGLGLDGAPDATGAVLSALRDRSTLLVLDNAEHLLDGVAALASRLRDAAPGVRLLVTSQEPLRIADEVVFRPEPLSLPESDEPERIGDSGAVALFVARAKAADRRFEMHAGNRAAVAEICRRLDGIPLAIELAAARVPLLGVEGLREKLDQRLHVLTTGFRASLHRHQTLRAALEWSHHLLSPAEQAVLRRLGAFAGGFTLEAAQQVAEDEQGIDRWEVLEHLGGLVEKSLVVAETDAVPRYRMLETTRLFALERLIESGEAAVVRGHHRDHFLMVAEACQSALLCGDSRRTIARLDLERDNLFLALAWAPGDDDARPGLRLAAAMHNYWYLRALPRPGIEVTRIALERPGARVPSLERCRALVTAGWMGMRAGDYFEALQPLEEALHLARELGDARTLCLVLTKLAHVHHNRHEPDDASRLTSEALAVGRPLGDSIELGDALALRAHVHFRETEFDAAHTLFHEALAMRERMHNLAGMVMAHLCLAQLAVDRGRAQDAKPHLDDVAALMPQLDSQQAGLIFIGMTAEWAAVIGQHETAVLLDAACEKQFRQAGIMDRFEPYQVERFEQARLALGIATCERLRHAGRAMSYPQAMQGAHSFLTSIQPPDIATIAPYAVPQARA